MAGDIDEPSRTASEAVRLVLEAVNRRDPEALVDVMHPDVELFPILAIPSVRRPSGNQELAFLAHNCRFQAERIQQPSYRWHRVCLQVIQATFDGRTDDAERLGEETLRIRNNRSAPVHAPWITTISQEAHHATYPA